MVASVMRFPPSGCGRGGAPRADALEQAQQAVEPAPRLGAAQAAEQGDQRGRRGGVVVLEVGRGPPQQAQDLGLGHVAEGLEHEHDVVAERLDVVAVEGADHPVDDAQPAADEVSA
jgi:hypothetical protein